MSSDSSGASAARASAEHETDEHIPDEDAEDESSSVRFEDLTVDDDLPIIERVVRFSRSGIALQRLVHVKMLAECAELAGCVVFVVGNGSSNGGRMDLKLIPNIFSPSGLFLCCSFLSITLLSLLLSNDCLINVPVPSRRRRC